MSEFNFTPSCHVPFRDIEAINRCRRITRSEITTHSNPDLSIKVIPDADIEFIWVTDMFARIKQSADEGRKLVLILPNPCPSYRHLARLINGTRIDCSKVVVFAMDEYANEHGDVAPDTWELGFGHAMKKYLVSAIDPELRMPERSVHIFTTGNVKHYSKMIADHGGADACYSGPGWTGHLAFIEPDAPEFDLPLEEWKKCGSRIVTLSPFTLAQNSLHGAFGMSGDLSAVPPKAATIGPADVIASKYRMDVAALLIHGTQTTWQRLIARLCYHGPVTPKLPTSIHQLLRSDVLISESIAADIQVGLEKGY